MKHNGKFYYATRYNTHDRVENYIEAFLRIHEFKMETIEVTDEHKETWETSVHNTNTSVVFPRHSVQTGARDGTSC